MTTYRDRHHAGEYDNTAREDKTNEQLKAQLKAKDLPISGNKDELITRLEDADNE